MKFTEKNDFTVRHQGAQHFHKDLETFKKHFPHHALNTQLAKANQFSFARLDSQMLFILLDKVPASDILNARLDLKKCADDITLGAKIAEIKDLIIESGLNTDDFTEDQLIQIATGPEDGRLKTDEEIQYIIDNIVKNKVDQRFEELKSMIVAAGLNIADFSEEEIKQMASGSDEDVRDLLDTIAQNLAKPEKSEAKTPPVQPDPLDPPVLPKQVKTPAPKQPAKAAPKADDKKKGSNKKSSPK